MEAGLKTAMALAPPGKCFHVDPSFSC